MDECQWDLILNFNFLFLGRFLCFEISSLLSSSFFMATSKIESYIKLFIYYFFFFLALRFHFLISSLLHVRLVSILAICLFSCLSRLFFLSGFAHISISLIICIAGISLCLPVFSYCFVRLGLSFYISFALFSHDIFPICYRKCHCF